MGSDEAHRSDSGDPQPLSPDAESSRRNGPCCFLWPPIPDWERIRYGNSGREPWWRRAIHRAKEWSEIVEGLRWKTFFRRLNRGGVRRNKFQYDPLSYAMNFDEGNEDLDGEGGFRAFSARFAAPPKASMDLDGDGGYFPLRRGTPAMEKAAADLDGRGAASH